MCGVGPEVRAKVQAKVSQPLSDGQVQQFERDGCLFVPASQLWRPAQRRLLLRHSAQVAHWGTRRGAWMRYLEPDGRTLQRIENFVPYSPPLWQLPADGALVAAAGQLFGEPALLHKDKINYKLPGGGGFAPHQDVAAGWARYGQSRHISAYVAIDRAASVNSPLEAVSGAHTQRWSRDGEAIAAPLCARMRWQAVLADPCDVFFFDSYVPHRSASNQSRRPRRACYCTYSKASEGDWRVRYFADKRRAYPPDAERRRGRVYTYEI